MTPKLLDEQTARMLQWGRETNAPSEAEDKALSYAVVESLGLFKVHLSVTPATLTDLYRATTVRFGRSAPFLGKLVRYNFLQTTLATPPRTWVWINLDRWRKLYAVERRELMTAALARSAAWVFNLENAQSSPHYVQACKQLGVSAPDYSDVGMRFIWAEFYCPLSPTILAGDDRQICRLCRVPVNSNNDQPDRHNNCMHYASHVLAPLVREFRRRQAEAATQEQHLEPVDCVCDTPAQLERACETH